MRNFSHRRASLPAILFGAGIVSVLLSRLCHLDLVWIEEAYGMAAAAELLRGQVLYTQVWFDKPPLYALFYMLCGGQAGWPLRLLDIAWILSCVASTYLLARKLWDVQTGLFASALVAVGLTFWIPSAVMAVAPDLLMFVPHVLAVWAIASGRPLLAGALVGTAVLCNSKGLLLLVLVLAWNIGSFGRTLTGFVLVQGLSLGLIPVHDYWRQVWWWGARYSSDTFIEAPVREFLLRMGGWLGFHATAALACGIYLWRTRDWRVGLWLALSFFGVIAGLRFFPRYFFQLLPVVALAGGRGLVLIPRQWQVALLALLLIPIVRFGPRYASVAQHGPQSWTDAALMEDSRQAAKLISAGTILVWGYRPDVFVFSGEPAGTPFLDSQPLTGVLADRHLISSEATFPDLARQNRKDVTRLAPDYIVDGLGLLNPDLAISRYPELHDWFGSYQEIGRTRMSVVFRRRPDGSPPFQKR